jgi:multidrug resistance efflux pump
MAADAQVQKTADAIRRLVKEIADLAAADIPRQAFFGEFLTRAVRAIDAMGGAVWIGRQGRFNLIADVDLPSSQFVANARQNESIRAALRWVEEHGRPLIIAPMGPNWLDEQESAGIPNYTPMAFFYVPIQAAGTTVGVVQVWQRPGRDPKTYRPFMELLISVTRHAETYLESRHLETVVRESQRLEQLLLLAERVSASDSVAALGLQVVSLGRELVSAERLTLLVARGGACQAVAISGQPKVDRRSEPVRSIEELGGAALVARDARAFRRPLPGQDASTVSRRYFLSSPYDLAVFMPLRFRGEVTGVLVGEYPSSDGRPTDADLAAFESLARQIGPVLGQTREREAMPLRRTVGLLAQLRPQGRKRPLILVGVIAFLLALAAIIPMKADIEGRCTVWPVSRAAIVSEEEGRIAEVLAVEGQKVEVGQPLLRIESPTLATSLEVARREVDKWRAEAQGREAAGDPSAAQIATIHAEKAAGEVAHLRKRLESLMLTSPMAGTVVTHDPRGRLGEAVTRGTHVLDVADLAAWEVVVEVPEKNVRDVERAVTAQGGAGAEFILASRPGRTMHAAITSLSQVSQVARPVAGRNVYLVRGNITEKEAAADLRMGYEGRARIEGPRKSILGSMVDPFLDYLRIALF